MVKCLQPSPSISTCWWSIKTTDAITCKMINISDRKFSLLLLVLLLFFSFRELSVRTSASSQQVFIDHIPTIVFTFFILHCCIASSISYRPSKTGLFAVFSVPDGYRWLFFFFSSRYVIDVIDDRKWTMKMSQVLMLCSIQNMSTSNSI